MRKKIFSLITALSVVITSLPMLSLSARAEGTGTEDNPFLIYNANDLAAFRNTVNAGNVTYCARLMNDIDLSSVSSWSPISPTEALAYKGTFDGDRHTISNFKIATNSTANLGLFGVIDGGTVTDVALSSASINNTYNIDECSYTTVSLPEGFIKIVGTYTTGYGYTHYWDEQGEYNDATAGDYFATGSYTGSELEYDSADEEYYSFDVTKYYGWTINWNNISKSNGNRIAWRWETKGSDSDRYNDGHWKDNDIWSVAGRVVLAVADSSSTRSWYKLCGRGSSYNGDAGKAEYAAMYNKMYNARSTTVPSGYTQSGPQSNTGGITAVLKSGTVEFCSYDGTITSNYARAGGLVGWQQDGTLKSSYSTGSVKGTYAGGAVGILDGGSVENCYSTMTCERYNKVERIYNNISSVVRRDYENQHWIVDAYTNQNRYYYSLGTYLRDSGEAAVLIDIYNYYVDSDGGTDRTIHPGDANGLVCSVSDDAAITNCYYYNEEAADDIAFTDNLAQTLSTYILGDETTYSTNNATLTETDYANESKFNGWDFDKTWIMSEALGRPVLYDAAGEEGVTRPQAIVPTGDDAVIKVIAGSTRSTTVNIASLVKFTTDESFAGRIDYYVADGGEYALMFGDEMIVKAPLPVGEYGVTLSGHDTLNHADDFTVNLTIRAIEGVPAPEALNDGFKYSRERTLATVEITEGWQWVDPTIVPTNDPNEGYDAVYYFGENSPDLYDLSAIPTAVYDEVTNALFMKVPVEVLASPESPWTTYITVLNGDTDEIIEGASVYHTADYEFPLGHETGTDGRVYAELTAGKQTLTAHKTGFDDLEAEVNIMATRGNEVTIKMKPARNMLKMPKVLLRDGTKVPKVTVTVQKLSTNSTKEWEDGSVSAQYAADSEQGLPIGEYRFTNATHGYTQTEAVYAKITAEDGIKLYSDAAFKNEITQDEFIIYVDLFSDPTYRVTIDRESETSTEYWADITLENIVATYGTFGIRYDPELFEFDPEDESNLVLKSNLRLKLTPDDSYGTEWKNENGYVAFVWQPKGDSSATEFDATEQKAVARIKFKLKNVENADIITLDTFGVQAWNETAAAESFAATLRAHNNAFSPNEFFDDYWRYYDNENNAATLGIGRLAKVKAVVNGIDTGGFHQAAVNAALGDTTENAYFYDIRTLITYNFEVKGSVFKFHTVDKQTGENLSAVALGLYGGEDEYFGAKKTDTYGRATYAVNEGDYTYTAALDGYWPIPLSGFSEDRPTVTAETGKAKDVLVELEKKIYHVPEVINTDLVMNEDATVGGEKYGYNGRDFHFRIKAAPGYRITSYPQTAEVTVGETTVTLDVNPKNGTFKLGGEYLNQDPLTTEELLALDPSGTMPDENGFRSDNIRIKFGEYTAEEIAYEVTAYTNENGIVTYTRTTPFDDGLAATTDTDHEKLIKTTHDNKKTGTFTFTPAAEGYVIERVYINGLETDIYNGETTFDYSFGEVETNNNITVIYYDGTNKTDDTVLTLVVGDYGAANVTKPGTAEVQNMTKTYLNPQPSLEFTAVPMVGYELAGIDVSVNGGARSPVEIYRYDTEHNYVFEPPDTGQSKTVYVTFKDPEARKTPTVFVKAYVARGKGETDPAGILVYNLYDQPEFTLTASDMGKWLVDSVRVSPFEDTENYSVHEYEVKQTTNTYTLEPLKADTAMGAVFVEKGYVVKGKVDLSQGSNVTRAAPTTGATVTFTREGTPDAEEYKTKTTASRKDAVFTIEVPAGTWTVTVTKQGYVKYVITGFTFDAPEDETAVTWFGGDSEETAKKITPYIGSTQTGTSVSLLDAATVTAGMRTGVSGAQIARADADDDGEPNARDIAYVFFNYGVRTTRESYADFLTSAQPDKPEIDV